MCKSLFAEKVASYTYLFWGIGGLLVIYVTLSFIYRKRSLEEIHADILKTTLMIAQKKTDVIPMGATETKRGRSAEQQNVTNQKRNETAVINTACKSLVQQVCLIMDSADLGDREKVMLMNTALMKSNPLLKQVVNSSLIGKGGVRLLSGGGE